MKTHQANWTTEQAHPEDAAFLASLHSESFKDAYFILGDDEHNERVAAEATAFLTPDRIQARAELINVSGGPLHRRQVPNLV